MIIHNLERKEAIASQRKELDDRIFAELLHMSTTSSRDSVETVVFNCVASGRVLGPHASEYSQTTLQSDPWLYMYNNLI